MCLKYSYGLRFSICCFSVICSFIVIFTFRVSSRWSSEYRDAKRMLLFSSVANIPASIAFALESASTCFVQAVVIQFFQIGAVFYVTFISIEIKYAIETSLAGKYDLDYGEELSWLKARHLIYHSIVLCYCIAVTTWMGTTGEAGVLNGSQSCVCWFQHRSYVWYFALIPVGIAQSIVIFCYVSALLSSYCAINGIGLRVELSAKSKCVLRRLVALPIVFFLLWVPTVVYISMEPGSSDEFLSYFWIAAFPSAGIYDALIFVFSDVEVLQEWKLYLLQQPLAGNRQAESLLYSDSSVVTTLDRASTQASFTKHMRPAGSPANRPLESSETQRDSRLGGQGLSLSRVEMSLSGRIIESIEVRGDCIRGSQGFVSRSSRGSARQNVAELGQGKSTVTIGDGENGKEHMETSGSVGVMDYVPPDIPSRAAVSPLISSVLIAGGQSTRQAQQDVSQRLPSSSAQNLGPIASDFVVDNYNDSFGGSG